MLFKTERAKWWEYVARLDYSITFCFELVKIHKNRLTLAESTAILLRMGKRIISTKKYYFYFR